MKIKALALISALFIALGLFSGCGEGEKATPDEALSSPATPDEAISTAETAALASASADTQPSTAKNTTPAAGGDTQPSTVKPVQDNIPADSITSSNINPNLFMIQDLVIAEINGSMLQAVSLSQDSVMLKKGETAGIKIYYDPEDAVPKTCTVKSDSDCAEAGINNGYLTIVGKSEGSALITITAYSGAYAQCLVSVSGDSEPNEPAEITDDTVLFHSKVCTAENAQRWLEALNSYCADLGLVKNDALSGDSVVISTSDYGDGSFNSYKNQILGGATLQIDAHTGTNYSDYEYNCELRPSGKEYKLVITLYRSIAE